VPYNALGKDGQGENFNRHTIKDALKVKTMFELLSELLQSESEYKVDMQPCVEMITTDESGGDNYAKLEAKILDANVQCINQGYVVTDGINRTNWSKKNDELILVDTGEVYEIKELFERSINNNGDKNDKQYKQDLQTILAPIFEVQLLILFSIIGKLSDDNAKNLIQAYIPTQEIQYLQLYQDHLKDEETLINITLINILQCSNKSTKTSVREGIDKLSKYLEQDCELKDGINKLSKFLEQDCKLKECLGNSTIFDANPPPPPPTTPPANNKRFGVSCNIFRPCYQQPKNQRTSALAARENSF